MSSVAFAPAIAQDADKPDAAVDATGAAAADMPDPSPEEAGAYLAARLAARRSDYGQAARYYRKLILAGDTSLATAGAALTAEIAVADFDQALPLANGLVKAQTDSQVAAMTVIAHDAKDGKWADLIRALDNGVDPGPLLGHLVRAWALVGEGRISDASAAFDKVGQNKGLGAFAGYHKALALALAGDYGGADQILSGENGTAITSTRRSVLAHVEILSRLERDRDAIKRIDASFGDDLDPQLADIRARLERGETLPFDAIHSATDGAAEVYFSVAQGLLAGDAPDPFTLVHARLAAMIRPDFDDATLLSASILEQAGQYDLAIKTYATVRPESPIYHAAEIGRAEAMVRAGRFDAAIEVLENLSRLRPGLAGVWVALGDTLRRQERYKEAVGAYDRAVSLKGKPESGDWFVWYSRSIAQERLGDWADAEKGFREALRLSPDQPSVLNYLGYSYVVRGENLEEALAMIRKAADDRPDAGFIIDSLGWALFKLGHFQEAVTEMERAVQLEPRDPLLNDHLGDVLWAVGRRREAAFQWRRALNFGAVEGVTDTEDLDRDRIRQKLKVGLGQVRKEEGKPPLRDKGPSKSVSPALRDGARDRVTDATD